MQGKFLVLVFLWLKNLAAFADFQEVPLRDSTILLKEVVVVTAQRMALRGDAVAESVVTQNRDQLIRLSPLSTPDAMAAMPGVWMQKTNHGGGSPFIRGLTGYHTLLLMDGIRFNNSTFRSGPNQYLNTVDMFTLSRMEVLRGQGSVQYGSDGIGGVAQLFFRDPEFSGRDEKIVTGRLYANYVNHDMEYAGRAEVELATEKMAVLGGFSYKQFGDLHAGGDLGTLHKTGYDEQAWDIKFKSRIGRHLLTGAWQHAVQHDVPLYHQLANGSYSRYHFNPQQRDLGYLRLESFYDSKIFNTVRYTVAYLNSLEQREKQRSGSAILRNERDEIDTYHGAAEVISSITPHWKVSTGIEFYHDRIGSTTIVINQDTQAVTSARGLYPDGSHYLNGAVFSLHAFDWNRFHISLGARYNLVRLTVDDPVFGETSITPQSTVVNSGVVYKVNPRFDLIASANTGFRAPNINDVSSFGVADYRYEVPNYNLGPEKSFQYQVGLRMHTESFRAELYAYQNRLKDLIANVPAAHNGQDSLDGFRVYQKENVNEALIQGLEIEVAYQRSWLTAFVNTTYTHGQNITRDEPLSRIPPLFGRLGTDLEFRHGFTWRLEFMAAAKQDRLSSGDQADSRIATGGTPGWQVFNTRLQYAHQHFRINTGIQNIFDEAYRIHGSGVDGPGRNFFVSLLIEISSRKR
ncbi:MAG: TonB-dependent receptor [Cyclobacteriaceae bacterium]|nr:TonB-dependent receptor [Cyclobacteriaceae bacterium]